VKHLAHGRVGLDQRAIGQHLQGDLLQRESAGIGQRADAHVPLLHCSAHWPAAAPLRVGAREAAETLVTMPRLSAGHTARPFAVALQRAIATVASSVEPLAAAGACRSYWAADTSAIAALDRAVLAGGGLAQGRGEYATGVAATSRLTRDDLASAGRPTASGAVLLRPAWPYLEGLTACATKAPFTAAPSNGVAVVRAVEVSRVRATSPSEAGPADGAGLRGMLELGAPDRAEPMRLAAVPTTAIRNRIGATRPRAYDGWPRRDLRKIGTSARAVETASTGALVRRCRDCVYASGTLASRRSRRSVRQAEAGFAAVPVSGLLCPLAALLADPRGRISLRHMPILGQCVKKNSLSMLEDYR
jgi:hypothetical protein